MSLSPVKRWKWHLGKKNPNMINLRVQASFFTVFYKQFIFQSWRKLLDFSLGFVLGFFFVCLFLEENPSVLMIYSSWLKYIRKNVLTKQDFVLNDQ